MIKKIPVERLKPGMFVHDLDCGWFGHPFFSSRFEVDGDRTIAKIVQAGIREVYIDTSKGLDAADALTEAEVREEIHASIQAVAEDKTETARAVPAAEEMAAAQAVYRDAQQIAHGFMEDVRLGRQIEVEKVGRVVGRMVDSIFRNQDALLSLGRLRQKDEYTFQHSVGVCVLTVSFSKEMGFDRKTIDEIGVGALLHDVGKMRVPLDILNKPGRLTEEEFEVVKGHVAESDRILSETPGIGQAAVRVAGEHHERYDGSGYPRKLAGEGISIYGQMAAIVDVYDAITSDRVYHKGMEPTAALEKVIEWSRFHFKEDLARKFVQTVGIYPVGSLVRLESGLLGIVVAQGPKGLLYPLVRAVYDSRKERFIPPRDVDLSLLADKGKAERIVGHESPKDWNIDPQRFL